MVSVQRVALATCEAGFKNYGLGNFTAEHRWTEGRQDARCLPGHAEQVERKPYLGLQAASGMMAFALAGLLGFAIPNSRETHGLMTGATILSP